MKPSLLIALAMVMAAGCAANSPKLKVVGVSQAQAHTVDSSSDVLLVFVEVLNPTGRPLQLSRLRYKVKAAHWFDTTGDITLTRTIRPHARAVLKLELPYAAPSSSQADGVPYTLEGKLYARENRRERSWKVRANGRIVPVGATQARVVRFRTAASH